MPFPAFRFPASLRPFTCLGTGLLLATAILMPSAQAEASAEEDRSDDPEVRLHAGTWDDVENAVRSARGKVVVVDIWSTSCQPCMDEFPNLVRLSNRWPDDVVCISFNVDYAGLKKRPPEFYRERVRKFLEESDADFLNVLSTEESDTIYERLRLPSIPAALVYGSDGRLAQQFDARMQSDEGEEEPFNYRDDIVPFVKRLLQNGDRR